MTISIIYIYILYNRYQYQNYYNIYGGKKLTLLNHIKISILLKIFNNIELNYLTYILLLYISY